MALLLTLLAVNIIVGLLALRDSFAMDKDIEAISASLDRLETLTKGRV